MQRPITDQLRPHLRGGTVDRPTMRVASGRRLEKAFVDGLERWHEHRPSVLTGGSDPRLIAPIAEFTGGDRCGENPPGWRVGGRAGGRAARMRLRAWWPGTIARRCSGPRTRRRSPRPRSMIVREDVAARTEDLAESGSRRTPGARLGRDRHHGRKTRRRHRRRRRRRARREWRRAWGARDRRARQRPSDDHTDDDADDQREDGGEDGDRRPATGETAACGTRARLPEPSRGWSGPSSSAGPAHRSARQATPLDDEARRRVRQPGRGGHQHAQHRRRVVQETEERGPSAPSPRIIKPARTAPSRRPGPRSRPAPPTNAAAETRITIRAGLDGTTGKVPRQLAATRPPPMAPTRKSPHAPALPRPLQRPDRGARRGGSVRVAAARTRSASSQKTNASNSSQATSSLFPGTRHVIYADSHTRQPGRLRRRPRRGPRAPRRHRPEDRPQRRAGRSAWPVPQPRTHAPGHRSTSAADRKIKVRRWSFRP